MPLINGQKMACEPCIRGHRSTKCTHANERLMVPVRKPGRPLSSCPHVPSSRNCGCGGVTAAIPRKQKCHCGTATAASSHPPAGSANANGSMSTPASSVVDIKTESSSSPVDVPPSPTTPKTTNGSQFRVQKSGARSAVRKQSIDPANLERMDVSNLNVLAPAIPHPGAAIVPATTPGIALDYGAAPPLVHNEMGFNPPIGFLVYQSGMTSQMPPPAVMSSVPSQMVNGPSDLPITAPPTPATLTGGSCCAPAPTVSQSSTTVSSCCSPPTNGTPAAVPRKPDPASPKGKSGVTANPKVGGSCCGGGGGLSPAVTPTMGPAGDFPSATNGGLPMAAFSPHMPLNQGMYPPPFYSQPILYTYPPQYGSYLQPLQPAQWRQTMETLDFASFPIPPSSSHGHPPSHVDFSPGGGRVMGTTHQCSCGDACQCIGCAAHPYNEATQNYVRSAWNSMVEENGHVTNGVNGVGVEVSGGVGSAEGTSSARPRSQGGLDDATAAEPAGPQTPSDGGSGISEEQALSASDFFFVTYPLSGDATCLGDTASCPCGDDCQCIGCAIHGNNDFGAGGGEIPGTEV